MRLHQEMDEKEQDDNNQESSVPPSTPVHLTRPQQAAFAFPGMAINAQLAAGSMRASIDPSLRTFSSLMAAPLPPANKVSFAVSDDRPASHDRKRNRRALLQDDGAIDDIMSQITMKLTTLSTESTTHRQDSILAFLDVLGCSDQEAEFYLESSDWDIQTAVTLYLENNPHPLTSFDNEQLRNQQASHHNYTATAFGGGIFPTDVFSQISHMHHNNNGSSNSNNYGSNKNQWRDRVVEIVGLDPIWEARVNPYDGCIFFRSKITGITQKHVPIGFADIGGGGRSEPATADEMLLMQASIPSSPDLSSQRMNDETDTMTVMSSTYSVSTNYTNVAQCGTSDSISGSNYQQGMHQNHPNIHNSNQQHNQQSATTSSGASSQSGASVYSANTSMHHHQHGTNKNDYNSKNNSSAGQNSGFIPPSVSFAQSLSGQEQAPYFPTTYYADHSQSSNYHLHNHDHRLEHEVEGSMNSSHHNTTFRRSSSSNNSENNSMSAPSGGYAQDYNPLDSEGNTLATDLNNYDIDDELDD